MYVTELSPNKSSPSLRFAVNISIYIRTIAKTCTDKRKRDLLEELLDGRHELGQHLALVGAERLREGEHLRRLELAAEQVQREGAAGARAARRRRLRRRRQPAADTTLRSLGLMLRSLTPT